MSPDQLEELLRQFQNGALDLEQTKQRLARLPFSDLGFARVDHHRALRQGVPEVVFAPGKSVEHVVAVAKELSHNDQTVLVTRLDGTQAAALQQALPALVYNPVARTAVLPCSRPTSRDGGRVLVITAGTSDLPVAEEAAETLRACGVSFELLADVGVAGLHRLLSQEQKLKAADVLIVVAGMEGALASVVGGLVRTPVIAVPTSVGYGVALQGLTALFGMLTSCASGVTCVNIDNGFGAAMAAVRMLDTFVESGR